MARFTTARFAPMRFAVLVLASAQNLLERSALRRVPSLSPAQTFTDTAFFSSGRLFIHRAFFLFLRTFCQVELAWEPREILVSRGPDRRTMGLSTGYCPGTVFYVLKTGVLLGRQDFRNFGWPPLLGVSLV